MHRLTTTSFWATAVFVLVAPVLPGSPLLAAQDRGCGAVSNAFELAVGVAQSDRVDATASPMQFGGRGAEAILGFDHSIRGLCFLSSARGGRRTLSSTAGSSGSEQLIDTDVRMSLMKSFGARSVSRSAFAAGVELRANLAATTHTYTDPLRSTSTFRMGYASLGPSALWRFGIGRDAASIQLSSPLIAVVDHPYAPIWASDAMPHLRGVSATSFRGVNGIIAYTLAPNRRVSTVATYGFSVMRYDDVRPVRAVTQTLSAGMRVRLSSTGR